MENEAYKMWGDGMLSQLDEDISNLRKVINDIKYYHYDVKNISRLEQAIDDFINIQRLIKENFI